jgi:hypothetical protein
MRIHSEFYVLVGENCKGLKNHWADLRRQQEAKDAELEERRYSWWHYQMARLFGRRKEKQTDDLTMEYSRPTDFFNLDEANGDP